MTMRGLLAMVGAGAGVVALMFVLKGPSGSRAARTDASSKQSSQAQLGVRPDSVDSARRAAEEPSAPALPGVRLAAGPEGAGARSGEPPPPSTPVPLSPSAAAEAEEILAAQPRVLAAVEEALESQRQRVRRSCWNGDVPASASFPVEASYSAEGTMLALSVTDDRGAPAVGACLRGQAALVPPTIEAPGVGVTVRTALTLP